MAITLFVLGSMSFFGGLCASSEGVAGNLVHMMWVVVSALIMVAAMYLRSIGW